MDDESRAEAAAISALLRASLARIQKLRDVLAEAMSRDAALRLEVEAAACKVLARFYALAGKMHVALASRPR